MKRLAAILLTLVICYNTVGYFIVFKTSQLIAKREIKNLLKSSVPDDQLVVFRLTTENQNDFEWVHSKEFRYRGDMYDIVRKVAISATATDLYCIHDVKETGLFAHLDILVRDAMNHNKNTSAGNFLAGFFAGFYPPADNIYDFIPEETRIDFPASREFYLFPGLTVISPPPKS